MEANSSRLDPQFCFGDWAAEGVYVQQHERSPAVHVPDYEPDFIDQQWGIPNLICCYFQALEKKHLYPLWAFASMSKNTSQELHEQIRPHFTHKKIHEDDEDWPKFDVNYLSAGAIAILYIQFIISPVGLWSKALPGFSCTLMVTWMSQVHCLPSLHLQLEDYAHESLPSLVHGVFAQNQFHPPLPPHIAFLRSHKPMIHNYTPLFPPCASCQM